MPGSPRFLQLLGFEKGVVLWLPAVLLATAAVLFGIHQTVSDRALYNHARDLRVALGPVHAAAATSVQAEALAAGLAHGLREQRELTLVDSERVRARFRALSDGTPPKDLRKWLRSTRSLNVLYCLTTRLEVDSRDWAATLDVWEVASEQRVYRVTARAPDADALGGALADSVAVALFSPPRHIQATR